MNTTAYYTCCGDREDWTETMMHDEYEAHDAQERALFGAGWETLDVRRPWYSRPTTEPDGSTRTLVETLEKSPGAGYDWFWIDGEVEPPRGTTCHRTVFRVVGGWWVSDEEDARG